MHVRCGRREAGRNDASYDRITTTIAREWLAQIIAGTKKIEYRRIKPYWTKRLANVMRPFELRLINGMIRPVPEVTVLVHRVTKDRRTGDYKLHIKKVLGFEHWDRVILATGKTLDEKKSYAMLKLGIPEEREVAGLLASHAEP